MKKTFFALIGSALLLTLSACRSQAADLPRFSEVTLFTNAMPAAAAGSTVTNSASILSGIDVEPNTIFTVAIKQTGGNAGISNVVYRWKTSIDGAVWSTDYPYTATIAANATTATTRVITVGTNIPARFIALANIETTLTNTLAISPMTYTFVPSPR